MSTVIPPAGEHSIDRYIAARREADPKFSKTAFAEMCGLSRNAIYRVTSGDQSVSTDLFDKIELATGGELKAVEMFAEWHAIRAAARAAASDTDARADA